MYHHPILEGAGTYYDGTKFWCRYGLLHREDGPAIEYLNGTKRWYVNGLRHRIDGPAVIKSDGTKQWFLANVEYTCVEWMLKIYEMSDGG